MTNVNSFFRTKLAAAPKEKEDKILDPGEAAAAGLAIISSPLSTRVFPRALGNLISKTYPKSMPWHGDPVYGLKRLGDSGLSDEMAKAYAESTNIRLGTKFTPGGIKVLDTFKDKVNAPQKVLGGLFNLKAKSIGPISDENLNRLSEIQKSVNSMLDKYKLPEKGVTLSFRAGPLSKKFGPHYNFASKEIVLPRISKEIALHEIGHAGHLTGKGARAAYILRKTLQKGSRLAVPMAYVAGDEIKKMFPGEIDDKAVDFVQNHAPAIIASTYAGASLYPEVQATARAISHVKKTEGVEAAKKTAKKLLPYLLSYTIPIIPAMVGVSLARKWHREAKENQKKVESITKEAGIISNMVNFADNIRVHSGHLMKQIGPQAGKLLEKPLDEFFNTMYQSGKNVIKSPSFASGAAIAGIPTALISYLSLNTPHGKALAEKKRKLGLGKELLPYGKGSPQSEMLYQTHRGRQDSVTPAIVGITAALSGGFLAKLFTDLGRVL